MSRHTNRSRRGRPRRRQVRRAVLILAGLVPLGTAGLGWTVLRLGRGIEAFDATGLARNRPPAGSSRGENVLVIGSDARTDGNSALGGGDTHDVGRSDTTFLLHVFADRRHATAVSIPRDTLVTVPPCRLPDGSWTRDRAHTTFNSAYSVGESAAGNLACTQNTVERLTGLRVDHTVVVDFKGFAALTEAVGGVEVCMPQGVYQNDLDPHRTTRGALLFGKGRQTVSGRRALDYVRVRHGIGDDSDIGRIRRRQAFLPALIKKIRTAGLTPARLLPLADAATKSLTVDPGLASASKPVSFVLSLRNIDLHDTTFVTVPWRYDGDRVAVVGPNASRLCAALKADHGAGGGPRHRLRLTPAVALVADDDRPRPLGRRRPLLRSVVRLRGPAPATGYRGPASPLCGSPVIARGGRGDPQGGLKAISRRPAGSRAVPGAGRSRRRSTPAAAATPVPCARSTPPARAHPARSAAPGGRPAAPARPAARAPR
ncbi:LCP family protein [Streptomyces gibsoniae]|uniref:LCP family protein n=1 Tax=Streptomyces gibsoniae TaxID=3075529 RepID=A0ABU2TMD2_9ACTN|nr:LCP family protein [Streptomyces sp. DSM 41699]MDT0462099.1 LCP family protein [Streptomyces sp. DSM 41699]